MKLCLKKKLNTIINNEKVQTNIEMLEKDLSTLYREISVEKLL